MVKLRSISNGGWSLSMKRKLTQSFVLLFVGGLLGAGLFVGMNAAQEYRSVTGHAFWSKADDNLKVAYLIGYDDAEQVYRVALDEGAKPLCTDAGKAWIADFDRKFPMSGSATIRQVKEGIDEFYKDWKNQSVHLWVAQNIVRLQLAGRPPAEIEEATRKAREAASNK